MLYRAEGGVGGVADIAGASLAKVSRVMHALKQDRKR